MRELKVKLLAANQLVDDAEEKQMRSPMVRKWLDELKDALYVVGDLLDEINTEALRRKLEGHDDNWGTISSGTGQLRQNLNSTSRDEFDKTLEPKIVDTLDVLRVILNEKDVLGLKEGIKDRPQERMRQTTSRVDESDVYGRDKDRETIVHLLRSNDATGPKVGVLPIVGMGGIGKTTLAQLAYKDVKEEFVVQAWVCIGEEFDILGIAQTIYGRLTEQPCEITDLDLLSGKLEEVLMNKKFFFVLDDVWSADYLLWNNFMTHFKQYGVHGSKIIVTTRLEQVASMMGTLPSHHLREISEDDSWLLFAKHAFTDADRFGSHPDLEDIGRKINKKCKGLPLAAKSLGGLLHSVLNPKEWEKILMSDIWELPNDKILPALWLSYHYLPAHLKRCFAYCSIFPKDYYFTKRQLVLLWMTEDLLHPKGKEIVEEVGDDCFDILLSRSFFQHSATADERRESLFTMHDLINDLSKFVCGEFCLRLEDHQPLTINVSRTRHFSYMKTGDHDHLEKLESLSEAKYLHTFLPLPFGYVSKNLLMNNVLYDLLPKLQGLRVLSLSKYSMSELPGSIGKLKHLRHLDLSYTSINQLPETVCTLYNLQTLLLTSCRSLVELPTRLGRLINLRHLDISDTGLLKMPPDMSNLKDLQTLSDFVLDEQTGHQSIMELKKLQHLRGELMISVHDIVYDGDAMKANIMSDKKYLDRLVLRWRSGDIKDAKRDRELLNKLQPNTKLKELVICGYRDISFPVWLGDPSFSDLSYIELTDCEYCGFLPPLGQLPCLRELHIEGLKVVQQIGGELSGNCGLFQPFRCLEKLTLSSMLEWQEWSYEGGILPKLCSLVVWDCPKLTTLPLDKLLKLESLDLGCLESFNGSLSLVEPKFPCLTDLRISDCPNFVRFQDGGMDAPKLKQIYIEGCEKLRSLPEQMHTLLPSLQELEVGGCPELESFPQGGLPSTLESLRIKNCSKLVANRGQWGLGRLNRLRRLTIWFIEEVESCYAFPEEGLLPTTLTDLCIFDLPNHTTIQGKELRQLTSLQNLSIDNCHELQCFSDEAPNSLKELKISVCPKLQCLPAEWLPASLSRLAIGGCPLLTQRLERETGEDWPMIAHIPNINVSHPRI